MGDDGLLALEKNLAGAGVQVWETLKYGGTSHGFADPTNSIYDERAANQAHATMYSFFKAKMPPKADECEDSTTWHKNGDESKDCAWVSEWAPRCNVAIRRSLRCLRLPVHRVDGADPNAIDATRRCPHRSRAPTSPSPWSTARAPARHPRLSHTVRPLPPARIRRGRRIPPPERSLPRPR